MEKTNETDENLKAIVREKYGIVAREGTSCCGPTSCNGSGEISNTFINLSEKYNALDGYNPDADLQLGCGIPTAGAGLQKGQIVLDLGSGAGNDVFIAANIVGKEGKVIGVDMTPDMIKKARENARKLSVDNVEFRLGEIEALPVDTGSIDRILSNCVLNLVPNKTKAFQEMFRVLKPGGRFSVSDIVLEGPFPDALKSQVELYVGCISGAIQKSEYLGALSNAGFTNIEVVKEKRIEISQELLESVFTLEQIAILNKETVGAISITVQGDKSIDSTAVKAPCCNPVNKSTQGTCC